MHGLLAERNPAGVRLIAEGGVEAEELPHSLAVRAALRRQLPAAGSEVADEELKPFARTKTGAWVGRGTAVVRPDVGAAFGAYVLQAVHGFAQLPVLVLISPFSPPSLPSLRMPWIANEMSDRSSLAKTEMT